MTGHATWCRKESERGGASAPSRRPWRARGAAALSSPYAFLLPSAAVLGLFLAFPVVWSFLASFRRIGMADLFGASGWLPPGEFVGLRNYAQLFGDSLFWRTLGNTAFFAAMFIPGTLGLSLGMALLVQKGMAGTGLFRAVFFLPYVVSIVAAGLVWRWLFDARHGLVNALLALASVRGPEWLEHPQLAMTVIALMCVWRWSGYFMLIFLAGLQGIPPSLYEAAEVDGVGRWMTFRRVTLPLLRRPMLFVVIVLLIRTQNVFQEVYVMTGGGPANSTKTVAYLIWERAFASIGQPLIGQAAALSFLLFLVVIAVAGVQFAVAGRKGEG